MWDKTVDFVKSAAAMLQSGKVPPNTPAKYDEELGAINFLRSKKFFMVFFSILILLVFASIGVFVLFLTAPLPNLTLPYVTMFTKIIEILAIIIGTFLAAQTSVDLKYGSSSNVNLSGDQSYQKIESFDTKRIIREGEGEAPEIKPFGVIAVDEF